MFVLSGETKWPIMHCDNTTVWNLQAQIINLKERDHFGDAGIDGDNIKMNHTETGCVDQICVVGYKV